MALPNPSHMKHIDKPGSDAAQPGDNDRRISTAAARKMLGMIGKNYDDDRIAEVLDALYGIARNAYEVYQDEAENAPE